MCSTFAIDAVALRALGLAQAKDRDIFDRARAAGAVVMTKDADFVELVERLGTPPQIVWIRCGNTSSARLRDVLARTWPKAQELLESGERIVELVDRPAGTGEKE